MTDLIKSYRLLNALSLDVVVGALVCSLFFSRIFLVTLKTWELIALGFTVWIIYTADHLRDARKIQRQASTERHRFHQLHYKTLVTLTAVIIVLDAAAIFFVPRQVLIWGIALGALVSVYLFTHRLLRFFKEIFIAIMYTAGVLLPSLSVTEVEINASHYLLIVHFAVLALTNLLMFSWFDRAVDQHDLRHSFTTLVGERATRTTIWYLNIVQVLLVATQLLLGFYNLAVFLFFIMGLLLFVIFVFRKSFAMHDYYRLLGDAVFMVPIVYLA